MARRLFAGVAVEASAELLEQLEECRRVLGGKIRWVRPELWHLTLAFFGATQPERIPLLGEIVAATTNDFDGSIPMDIGGLELWGNARRGVLLVKMESPMLIELQSKLARRLGEAGIRLEERRFVPHLTLGRTRQGEHIGNSWQHCRELPEHRQTAHHLILFESVFTTNGVAYRHLNQYPLSI